MYFHITAQIPDKLWCSAVMRLWSACKHTQCFSVLFGLMLSPRLPLGASILDTRCEYQQACSIIWSPTQSLLFLLPWNQTRQFCESWDSWEDSYMRSYTVVLFSFLFFFFLFLFWKSGHNPVWLLLCFICCHISLCIHCKLVIHHFIYHSKKAKQGNV